MLRLTDVHQLLQSLAMADADLRNEVDCIVFRTDVFTCGADEIISRHIDIEFTFGEHCEISDALPLFDWICAQCSLAPSTAEETVLYQKAPDTL